MKAHKIRDEWRKPVNMNPTTWFYRDKRGIQLLASYGAVYPLHIRISARRLECYVDELRAIRRIEKGKK